MGATVIEKHFTTNKNLPGPDHRFSSDCKEMKELVDNIRKVEKILGKGDLVPSKDEEKMRKIARRSIIFNCDKQKNNTISETDLDFKRPGTGIPPSELKNIIGKRLRCNVSKNSMVEFNMLIDD